MGLPAEATPDILGQQLQLKLLASEPFPLYDLDDPQGEKRIRDSIGGDVRFQIPGWTYTQEYRLGRTNVHVDESGIVVKVTKG